MRNNRSTYFFVLVCALTSPVLIAQARDARTPLEILSISPQVITRGGRIRITGTGFSKDGKGMTVEIDGKETGIVKVKSENQIEVLVNTTSEGNAPEAERSVVVVLDGRKSRPEQFLQVTSWRVIYKPRVWVSAAVYLVLVALIVISVKGSVFKSKTGQLSLSKIQMGLWTFVFGLSYVLLVAIYKEFLDVTDGMFWLMGVSSATAVGAKAIVLKNKIDPKNLNPSGLFSDYNETTQSYALSLHRCQIAIWTLIVVIIYVIDLINTMHLPDIPDRLVVLMGISGGTYLGFNFPKRS
ncbi:MAG: IPT/TIG domain-containing protein [Candidatus Binatia bacterium]